VNFIFQVSYMRCLHRCSSSPPVIVFHVLEDIGLPVSAWLTVCATDLYAQGNESN